jgi:hypothetical protein
MNKRTHVVREITKLQVVREIERGELNYDQADKEYGIICWAHSKK